MSRSKDILFKLRYGLIPIFILFMLGAVIHLNRKGNILIPQGGETISIDGTPVSSPDDAEFVASWHRIGDQLPVVCISPDKIPVPNILPVVNYYSNADIIISIFTALVIFLVGTIVHVLRPSQPTTLVFYLASVTTSIALLGVKTVCAVPPIWFGGFLGFIFFISYGLTPVLFLSFTFYFPVARRRLNQLFSVGLYSIGFVLAVVHFVFYYKAALDHSVQEFRQTASIDMVQNGLAFLLFIAGAVNIILSYTKTQSASDRRKIRLVISGLLIGTAPFIFFWILPQTFGMPPLIPEYLFKLFLLFIPFMVAVSVLRYKLMDVDLLIHRGSVYSLTIGLVLLMYALLVVGVTLLIGKQITTLSPIYPGIAAILTALLFQPMKERLQRFSDKYFFRIEYDYREALRALIGEVKECIDLRSVAECLVRNFDSLLAVERIGVFILEGPSQYLRLYAHHGFPLLEKHGVRFEREHLKSTLQLPVGIPEYMEPTIDYEIADRDVFQRWGMVLVCPLLARQNEALGFLAVGQKKSGFRFTEEDIDLLSSIGHQAGVAIERLMLQNKLALEQAETERLEELNKMKSYFVSSVSHDMKTPLTSIKMFAELLRTKNRSEKETNNFLTIIEGESDRLTRLINNVLDFSRIERGVKEYHLKQIELNALVCDVLGSMNYQLQAEHVSVGTIIYPKELVIHADGDAVTEAIINLISNAVKYSPDVKDISIATKRRENNAIVVISDKGIGIDAENLQNIFQPFYQTAGARERGAGGLGLGLSIVKNIMDAHQGSIEVESTPGKGTAVTLVFPLAPNEGK